MAPSVKTRCHGPLVPGNGRTAGGFGMGPPQGGGHGRALPSHGHRLAQGRQAGHFLLSRHCSELITVFVLNIYPTLELFSVHIEYLITFIPI